MALVIKKLRPRPKAKLPDGRPRLGYFKIESFKGVKVATAPYVDFPFNLFSEVSPHIRSMKMPLRTYILRKFGHGRYLVQVIGGKKGGRIKTYFKGNV